MSPPAAAVEFARHGERQIVVGSGCVVVCERWRVVPPEMVLACGTSVGDADYHPCRAQPPEPSYVTYGGNLGAEENIR